MLLQRDEQNVSALSRPWHWHLRRSARQLSLMLPPDYNRSLSPCMLTVAHPGAQYAQSHGRCRSVRTSSCSAKRRRTASSSSARRLVAPSTATRACPLVSSPSQACMNSVFMDTVASWSVLRRWHSRPSTSSARAPAPQSGLLAAHAWPCRAVSVQPDQQRCGRSSWQVEGTTCCAQGNNRLRLSQ